MVQLSASVLHLFFRFFLSLISNPDLNSFSCVGKKNYLSAHPYFLHRVNSCVRGASATTFSPDQICARAQAMIFLYRYEKNPAVTGSNNFTAVSKDNYYYDAVQWGVNNGIATGTSATTFGSDNNCTRAQMITFH